MNHHNPFAGKCIHGVDGAVFVAGRLRSLTCEHCKRQDRIVEELEAALQPEPAFNPLDLEFHKVDRGH